LSDFLVYLFFTKRILQTYLNVLKKLILLFNKIKVLLTGKSML
jgi:hypothetical protein